MKRGNPPVIFFSEKIVVRGGDDQKNGPGDPPNKTGARRYGDVINVDPISLALGTSWAGAT